MIRPLLATLIAGAALTGTGHAQSAAQDDPARASPPPARSMPTYDDGEPRQPGGYYDREDSTDARHDDPRAALPGHRQVQPQSGYPSAGYPPSGYNAVPPPPEEDEAHRADRARTSELNRNAYGRSSGYGSGYAGSGAGAGDQAQYRQQLAQHARDMQDYRAARARYAARIANWQVRTAACQAGDVRACDGPAY